MTELEPHEKAEGLRIEGLSFHHKGNLKFLFDDLSWTIGSGRTVALIGASGSGKSTLLRLIAGLERPYAGRIKICGETVFSDQVFLPPEKRATGLVFQEWALFPHLTVLENVCYGISHLPRVKRKQQALQLLTLLEMDELLERRPSELSGGQVQRVALARSLAPRPRLMMLDEPFSSLDASLRRRTRELVRSVLCDSGVTTLLVTHDQGEAEEMAEEVWEMSRGGVLTRVVSSA